MAHLCGEGSYYLLMHIQCPRTCGRCDANGNVIMPPPVVRTGCYDSTTTTGSNTCPRAAQYCNNHIYKQLMRQQCARTCGFCV
ncbi:shTK domain protein [Oesophagostomum dentatum]|uniref:ShTK domain protein n=1 Tax=Oesophagostomum dentatum TaxID=61180 RepID=A0A0B1SKR8_OESDE|nr:shTK domain protein [Oesophagostomum dentatum]